MTKLFCPCTECIYNKDQRCKSKEIRLSWRSICTVNEGRQDVWICDQYQISDESQEIINQLTNLYKKKVEELNG